MELRHHPWLKWQRYRSWPPEWKGPHGPDKPLPIGEVGILTRVDPGIANPSAPHCFLTMQWNDLEYVACLFCDDGDFLKRIYELLAAHISEPISEIGALEIS